MHKQKVLKTILLSTAVLTVASTAIMLQQNQNSVDRTVKTEEVSKQDLASSSSEVSNVKTKTESTTSTKAEEKPVANETVTLAEKPVETEITVAQAEAKPVETKTDTVTIKEVVPSERPVANKLVEKQVTKVAEQHKVASKPIDQPKVDKPTETKPIEQPKTEAPKAEQPNVEAPKVEKVEQPKTEKPVVAEKTATPAPAVEKPAPQPKVEAPKTEVPAPKAETPVAPQPKAEAPAPKVEQPKAETPVVAEKGEALVQPELPEYYEAKGEPEVQPTLPEFTTPSETPSAPVEQPKLEQPVAPKAPVVAEKGEPLVQPELSEFHAENGEALVQTELPEYHEAKSQPEVQPALTELVVPAENTQPEQPAVPEAPIVTEKGEPLVQPELPEFHAENGTPEVQPELPEFHAENGDALVQPELPEFHAENGTPEVQPELPEFHFETGDALVQPELPEYHESKGEPEVQPTLLEFKLKTVSQEETIKIPAVTMNVTNSELNEGETKIVTQPKDGSITREYEVVLDEHDNVLSKKLINEKRVEAIKGVTSIGTKPVKKVFGETGMYRFSEHLSDENILEFREDVKLTADEIHALGQDEINKRAEQNLENTITVQDKQRQNLSHMDSAPLSDETINNLNGDTYINHKNIGLKVLELVNAERKRLGVHELTWSDPLYTLTKIRANEVRENGSIRFYTEDGQTLKHVRDDKGIPWYTVRDNTEFEDSALGENLAGYSIRPNVYKAFSEKYIADQLYNQWKNSPHHYANMIKEKYNRFAFDVAYSKFWRDGHTDVTYKKQGVLGVQLFAD